MSGRLSLLLVSVSVLGLVGCGDSGPAAVDAGAQIDSPALPMSRLLGRCEQDWQCPGETSFCRTAAQGYPSGQCTQPCTDRTDCDDGAVYNSCLQLVGSSQSTCEAFCRNGSDCRPGYTCQVTGQTASGESEGFCVPVCATDDECGAGTHCDVYTGRCTATPGTTGAMTGEACANDGACRSGNCRQSQENGNYTGFVNGYCQSLCRIPAGYNTSNFFSGDALPQGTCGGDAVCIPAGSQYGAGDLGVCLASCSGTSGCREGYTCVSTQGGHTFTNGYCVPVDCSGTACPTGFTCHPAQDAQGNTYGICG